MRLRTPVYKTRPRKSWPNRPSDAIPYTHDEEKQLREALWSACRPGIDAGAAWNIWWPLIRSAATEVAANQALDSVPIKDTTSGLFQQLRRIAKGGLTRKALVDDVIRNALMYGAGISAEDLDRANPLQLIAYAEATLTKPGSLLRGIGGRPLRDQSVRALAAVLVNAVEAVSGRSAGTSSDPLTSRRRGPTVRVLEAGLRPFTSIGSAGIRDLLSDLRRPD